MTEKEKNLRVAIMHLREELLISEKQIFYRLFSFLRKNNKTKVATALKSSDPVKTLKLYQHKLEKIKSSPFMLVISMLKLLYGLFSLPKNLFLAYIIKREFQNNKQKLCDVINFGVIPYDFRKLRQQHLVEELATLGHRIFYIENRFRTFKKYKPGYSIYKKRNNVYVIKLNAIRDVAIYHQKVNQKEIKSLTASFNKLVADARMKRIVLKIDHPFWTYLLSDLKYPVIYDCMDDYAGFDITGNHILDLEKKLVKKADLTVVCSEILLKKIKKYKPHRTALIKNACEYDHFFKASNNNKQTTNEKKIIGFFGAIGEWIDDKLIETLAKTYPDYKILLIGEVQNPAVTYLENKYTNIKLLGEKPYNELPHFLKTFDACIIPFKINSHTTLIDPVKMYEYFASGKPVVTTAIKEIQKYKNILYYSNSTKEFINNIKQAFKENDKKLKEKRQQIAKENTWEKRSQMLHKEINKITNMVYNRKIKKKYEY